jgi:hypothetical protein
MILTVLSLILATGNVVPLFAQGTPFSATIPGAATTDFKTVVNFTTPVGSGAGRKTLIKFVTDATPASVQLRLEPLVAGTNGTRLPVTFSTAGGGSLVESDGVTDVATAIFAQGPLAEPVAAGHSLMLVTIEYADSYTFTAAEPWKLTIAEQPATRAYFGFFGPTLTDVTRGKLLVLSPTLEFGDLFEGIAVAFAPILPVQVQNVGTANITITSVPITNDVPAFYSTVSAVIPDFTLTPGKKFTTTFSDPPPADGLWVRSKPSALGSHSSTMTLNTNFAGESAALTLNTRGVSVYSHFVFDVSGSMSDKPDGTFNIPVGTVAETDSRLWKAKQAAIKVNDWIDSFTDGQGYSGLSTFPVTGSGNLVIDQGRSNTNHLPINFHMGLQSNGGLKADGGTPMQQGIAAGRTSMVNRLPALGLSTADRPNMFQAMLLLSDGAENSGSNARLEITPLKDNGIKVFAAAYGKAGEFNLDVLKALSVGDGANPGGTGGEFYDVDAEDEFALRNAFKASAAAFIGLDPIVDPEGTIRRSQTRSHTVCVGSDAFGVSFSVDWNRNVAGAIDFTLRDPKGATITPGSPNIKFFQSDTHATYVIRGPRMRGGQGAGQWTLQLTGGNGIPNNADTRYNYSVLAQSPHRPKPKLRGELYTTEFHPFEILIDQPLYVAQPAIQVQYNAPVQSLGTFLATNSVRPEWVFDTRNPNVVAQTPIDASGRTIPSTIPSEPGQPRSIAARKAEALAKFGNKPFPKERKSQTVQLFDNGTHGDRIAGDGIYSSDAPEFRVAGTYNYVFGITTPPIATFGCFDRQIVLSRYVDVKLLSEVMTRTITWQAINSGTFFDPSVAAAMGGSPQQGLTRRAVSFTPQDTIGNMWGPGRANEIKFTVAGATPVGGVIDNWDGSYLQVVDYPTGTTPTATVTANGVTSGSVPAPTTSTPSVSFWSLGLRGGVAIPNGTANNLFDPGGAFTADLEYHATNQLSAVGLFGYRRMSSGFPLVSGVNVFQFSGGAKAYLTGTGQLRPFVNGGIGGFKFDPGSTKFGVYGGGGLQYRAWPRVWLEGEYNYHTVFTTGSNFNFSTVQGGVRFRF